MCREVTHSGTQGLSCVAATHCAQAHSCVDDPAPGSEGTCKQFCDTDDDCTGSAGSLCEPRVGTTLQRVCTTGCVPVDAAGCAGDFTCVIAYEGTGGARAWTDCRLKGDGKQGDLCTDHDDCKRGHFCRANFGLDTCVEYCVKEGENTCPSGTSCKQLDGDNVLVGGVEYGYCGI